mmetsp:Transcript_128335/g.357249  ORF Transcript_128335/g.357249 Transcript_128335/m.357249 type:complete len:286 (+) Transcript_128335:75-932(+)
MPRGALQLGLNLLCCGRVQDDGPAAVLLRETHEVRNSALFSEDGGPSLTRADEEDLGILRPGKVLGAWRLVPRAVDLGHHEVGNSRHDLREGLPRREELSREAAPGSIHKQHDVLFLAEHKLLEGLPDHHHRAGIDDRATALWRLWWGLRPGKPPSNPVLNRSGRGLTTVPDRLPIVGMPCDDILVTVEEVDSEGVHVQRGHDLECLVHRRRLADLGENGPVVDAGLVGLLDGLDRTPVQGHHEIRDVLGCPEAPVVLRRFTVQEPQQLGEAAVRHVALGEVLLG